MKIHIRKLFVAMLILMAVFSLTACSKTREITVYSSTNIELVRKYMDLFEKEHPDIKVTYLRESVGTLTERLVREGEDTPADVLFGTGATCMLTLQTLDMLEPYEPENLEAIQSKFIDKDSFPPRWVGISIYEAVIVQNTELSQTLDLPEITSYQDLLKPEFKNLIIAPNPKQTGTGLILLSGLCHILGEEKAFEYLDELDENVVIYLSGGLDVAKKVADGEYPVGITYGYGGVSELLDGKPIELIFPEEGSGWDIEANALIKKNKIKDEAKIFLDWASSEELMNIMKDDYAMVTSKNAAQIPTGYRKLPIEQLLLDYDLNWVVDRKPEVLAEWIKRYGDKAEKKD